MGPSQHTFYEVLKKISTLRFCSPLYELSIVVNLNFIAWVLILKSKTDRNKIKSEIKFSIYLPLFIAVFTISLFKSHDLLYYGEIKKTKNSKREILSFSLKRGAVSLRVMLVGWAKTATFGHKRDIE